jgi:1,4-dihydroxy-6-naphthoate synthase
MTTAFLALKLAIGNVNYKVLPFNEIMESVACGQVHAGLIIHEGQLTYDQHGLHCAFDLGKWWMEETSLPLPLGCNLVRRDLGGVLMLKVSKILRASIEYSLAHRTEALDYALEFTPQIGTKLGNRFISMYVNDLTLDLGERGRAAVQELLRRSAIAGLSDWPVNRQIDFI